MKSLNHKRIEEVCQEYLISEEVIHKFILEEWIVPLDLEQMVFDDEDLARIGLILELKDELGIGDEAVLIILRLIDQVNFLRAGIKTVK